MAPLLGCITVASNNKLSSGLSLASPLLSWQQNVTLFCGTVPNRFAWGHYSGALRPASHWVYCETAPTICTCTRSETAPTVRTPRHSFETPPALCNSPILSSHTPSSVAVAPRSHSEAPQADKWRPVHSFHFGTQTSAIVVHEHNNAHFIFEHWYSFSPKYWYFLIVVHT